MILALKEDSVKKTRYTEEQIAYALKKAGTGASGAEVTGRIGVS